MEEFFIKLWSVIKPQLGKVAAFFIGAVCSALGVALSPETLQSLTEVLTALLGGA